MKAIILAIFVVFSPSISTASDAIRIEQNSTDDHRWKAFHGPQQITEQQLFQIAGRGDLAAEIAAQRWRENSTLAIGVVALCGGLYALTHAHSDYDSIRDQSGDIDVVRVSVGIIAAGSGLAVILNRIAKSGSNVTSYSIAVDVARDHNRIAIERTF